jgi:threonine dehydrogenase-like Zn-dependent dehydrogenase
MAIMISLALRACARVCVRVRMRAMLAQVIECGHDVEFIEKGDLVSVPFNIACGRCVTFASEARLCSWADLIVC